MADGTEKSPTRVLAGLLALALVGLIALTFYVFGLRSDLDELVEKKGGKGRTGKGGPAAGAAQSEAELQEGLDDLRECFNKALENTFEDFYRYVFGGETPPGPDRIVETCGALSTKVEAQLYQRDLDFPVDLAWVEGTDTMFFTEKATGNIRVMHGKQVVGRPCATVRASALGEQGTLGIVLDPGFEDNRYLYVYYTNAEPLENRVTRFTVRGDRCTEAEDIITGIPAFDSTLHVGGQLEIVEDKLFVSVGDGYTDPGQAQDTSTPLGKVNRYNLDGTIPEDNPFDDGGQPSPAWSYGHRNPFGLAYDEETEKLYATENGPDCDDELNVIEKGVNYGWGPGYECGTAGVGDDPQKALIAWTPPIVPTDPWFYRGASEELAGYLYLGDFGSGRLHQFTMNDEGSKVLRDEVVYDSPSQIVDVTEGPGELLYFATPTEIYRLVES